MKELWKPIEGYEGYYEVSNKGKVRSVDREVILTGKRAGEKRQYKGRELQPLNSQGHLNVHLQRGGYRENIGLGRLVALHFLDGFKESGKFMVKYLDGDPTNCSVENLTYTKESTDDTGEVENED